MLAGKNDYEFSWFLKSKTDQANHFFCVFDNEKLSNNNTKDWWVLSRLSFHVVFDLSLSLSANLSNFCYYICYSIISEFSFSSFIQFFHIFLRSSLCLISIVIFFIKSRATIQNEMNRVKIKLKFDAFCYSALSKKRVEKNDEKLD